MNHGIYRLVFDNEHNNWVAVAEFVRGHGKAKGAARVGRTRRHALAVSMGAAMMVAGMASALAAPAARQLPVRSTAAARPFVYHGSVAGGQPVTSGNTMTINQQTRTLGLNWESFNIGRDATVRFNQPDANSRVLNRIWDSNPSEIYGKLEANGQVYLINQNGILFGKDSQVNVGGLVASALNMSETMRDKLLDNGLPTTKGDSLEFAYDGTVGDFAKGTIVIEAGSEIKTPSGGRVVLIAPKTVENEGIIRSGGGAEAILAAGGKVILTAPDDPNLRGLLVETKSFSGKDSLGNTVTLDGTATNSGTINTGSGGVATLAALAVNQKGIVSASKAVNINGTTMLVSGETNTDRITINQRGSVAEVDWKSGFNVATGKTVEVVQSSKGDVLYNYVNDADRTAADGTKLDQAGRSTIDGTLKANGQVVLINEKGIDFGSNARVSASNFVASGLGMNPDIVDTGLLGQTEVTERAFYLKKAALMYDENDSNKQEKFDALLADFRQATINVANGAEIRSGDNGYVILAGGKVNQAGYISSKGGQVLLAAGADLYLKPGYSSTARGFTPEVNPLLAISSGQANPWLALSRGADANSVFNSGFIYTPLGDITLVGHKITQAGTLLSTTSVTTNGSIHLIARDQVATGGKAGSGTPDDPFTVSAPNTFLRQSDETGIVASTGTSIANADAEGVSKFISGRIGGSLTFADGSRTVVAIDGSDGSDGKTLTTKQTFVPSSIDAVARSITVGDAEVIAKGGNIRLSAQEEFGEFTAFAVDPVKISGPSSTPPAGVGIYIGNGALLDVSGTNATKSVTDLFVEVELRGDEFADNPVQRNSILRGKTAYVDIREVVEIANLESWFDNVAQSVYEKAAAGGKISIATSGSAIIQSGAELDVSGGAITYEAGKVRESYAITGGGRRYRLNDAPTNLRYGRLVTRWRKEAEYVEGKSAGTVSITGHSLAVDGTLKAKTTVGTRQREIGNPSTNRYAIPYGGQLIIKDAGQHFAVSDRDTASEKEKQEQYTKAQIVFVRGAANAAAGLDAEDSAGETLELSQSLVDNGFSRFDITSDGRIEIPADVTLNLAAGGSFKASGRQIVVAGDISAASGEIELSTRDTGLLNLNDSRYSTLTLASTASLSTAGRWVNDYLDGKLSRTAKAIDGGDITLESAYDLDLKTGSVVDVSGGGYVSNKRKLTAGDAGSITLATGGVEDGGYNFSEDGDLRDATLFLDGTLSGQALGEGGTLTVKTSQITFGETFTANSRNWTRTERLAADQVGAAFDEHFVDHGGFFYFNFVGRDGLTVANGMQLSPDPISWSLARNHTWFRQASGTDISSFATSSVLHPELRSAPTNISLATRSWAYGDLLIGENAYVGVSAEGSIDLMSMAQLTVLGTLEAPGGSIFLRRPATKDYDEVVDGETVSYNDTRPGNYYDVVSGEEYSVKKQSKSIYIGPNAKVLVSGTTVLDAKTRMALEAGNSVDSLLGKKAYKGTVLDGGTVTIDAGLGYVVTRTGSLIDVSGTTATLSQPDLSYSSVAYDTRTVGSAGGTVSIAAHEGMFLDGSFAAAGGQNAVGGSFVLHFSDTSSLTTPVDDPWNVVKPSEDDYTEAEIAAKGARVLTLYQSSGSHADLWPDDIDSTAYLAGNDTIDPLAHNGKASLDLAKLEDGGFGSWYLTSQNEMVLKGTVDASAANQVQLSAATFSAADAATNFALSAASVQIGNTYKNAGKAASATSGSAVASVSALDIGLVGTFSWSGFGDTTFASKGEIHFDSTQNSLALRSGGRTYNGQMIASGNLVLSAARLSPSTYSDFKIDLLSDTDSSITITRPSDATAATSLSAAGRLELAANTITHQGTITAPLGEVIFTAPDDTGTVLLGSDSVTSVAAVSDLLFGYTTESASTWQYNGLTVSSMPDKAIRIEAANTVVATGAQLDLSGGGDALAWEFTAGPGGKSDILSASSNTYAIIPNWSGVTATDGQLQQGYTISSDGSTPVLKVGDSISLGNNPAGLSGSYILLPARYAVLPGAYLVTVKTTDGTVLRKGQTQADGSWLVNATRSTMNANGSYSATSTNVLTVELASSNVVANRAEYITTSANEFFYGQSGTALPGDAGRLTAIGHSTLSFDPAVTAMRVAEIAAADGRTRAGRGLELDVAAPNILISDGSSGAGNGWSVLDQNKLNAIAASNLLIGGTRTVNDGTTTIETLSTNVTVSNTSGALSAEEIMLAATDTITVTGHSTINVSGSADESDNIVLAGDGAFLRAAEGEQASLSRTGTITRTNGDLIVENGAVVGGESLIFDATRENRLDGAIDLGDRQSDGSRTTGGNIAIGAGRINVVGEISSSTPSDGLVLGNNDLAAYAAADQIRLTSYTTLDLYGNATIGTASLAELVIDAAGIAGHGQSTNAATIKAENVVLQNSSPESSNFTTTSLGSGQLSISARTVEFADNATSGSDTTMRETELTGFGVRGFADVALAATGDVRFSGTGVTAVNNDASFGGNAQTTNLSVSANRIVTVGTADHLLTASGATTISRHANATGGNEDTGLGGSLELRAQSMDVSGSLSAAAGNLVLSAEDNIALRSGAYVAAEGTHVNFDDATVYAGGGTVTLESTQGNLTIDTGAVVSVSADSRGGDAGTLSLIAGEGQVVAKDGTLRGNSSQGSTQGVLNVDANDVSLDSLARAVTDASGNRHFTEGWDVRRRSGNLVLTESIKARDVKLSADAGNIDIYGTIDASGTKGGDIELYANRQAGTGGRIDLRAGSRLLAYATESVGSGQGTDGQGGTVIVGVSATSESDELDTAINFAGSANGKSAALIDVSTPEGSIASNGTVTFRAPRQDVTAQLTTVSGGTIDWSGTLVSSTATSSGSSYTLTGTASNYVSGMVAIFKAPETNTEAATVNVNGLGDKALLASDGSALAAETINANSTVVAVYDGTSFRLQTIIPQGTGSSTSTLTTYSVTPAALPASANTVKQAGYTVTFSASSANLRSQTRLRIAYSNGSTIVNLKDANGNNLNVNSIQANQVLTAVYTATGASTGEFRLTSGTALASAYVSDSTMAPAALAGTVRGASTVALEAYKTTRLTGDSALNASSQAAIMDNAQRAFASVGNGILSTAMQGTSGVVLRIGEEIRSAGNLVIGDDWDLSAIRFNGQPGALTLRAEGDLLINGTISDGFEGYTSYDGVDFNAVSRDAKLMGSGDSWSLRLVSGADNTQASPLAVKKGSSNGSIVLAENKLVRTGTGDISLAAAGDIKLRNGAAIYTAGVATPTPDGFNFTPAQTPTTASSTYDEAYFADRGGDVSIHAGGNIAMTGATDSKLAALRSINQWLFRAGGEESDLQWWSRIASFQQGVAAFGGGDITINAGKNVSNLLVAIPTSGRVPTDASGNTVPTEVLVQGGGDLTVRAGSSIAGGLYYVETGSMTLDAKTIAATNSGKNYTNIALGNADVSITATEDITLGRVFNPLWTKTDYVYNDGTPPTSWDALNVDAADFQVRFGTYGSESKIDVLSLEGDVTQDSSKVYGVTDSEAGPVMPSVVRIAALNGSINIDGALIQSPGKNGQLDLLAGESITLSKDITQLDIGQSMLPSLYNPVVTNYVSTSGNSFRLTTLADSVREAHSDSLWHASDYEASRVITQNGDITGSENAGSSSIFNEAVTVIAGGDINNVNLDVQHAHETDVSRIIAGGDINYAYYTDSAPGEQTSVSTQALGIQLGGAGRIEVAAGGDIDLADTNGIVTRGNLDNPFLSETGASITVMAGTQVTDASAANYANYDSLRTYLQGGTLATYLKTTGIDTADLAAMSDEALRDAFFRVVREIGRDAVETGDKTLYAKGRALIAALFPNTEGSGNDILLSVSQIKTERGGDIQLLTPTGSVIVGVAAPTLTKEASKQGIFTISGGDIFGMVEKNYLVNQSRTFTLDGGDIMLWSNHGDIDAGRGAKTQVATPPPVLVIRNGQIVVDTANAVTGSGIGVLASQDDTPASDMDLFAPDGTIDAGDAGLRSTGNIKLGAAVILNSSNISAGGAVSGAPPPVAAAAPVTSVASPTETASNGNEEIAATATNKEDTLGVLTVEVLDGGESTAPADQDDEKKKKKDNS